MLLSDFDYHLPEELIAQEPLADRAASRMLVVDRQSGTWQDRTFREFPSFLRAGDCLVLNDSRVFPSRLYGHREGHTGKVEVFIFGPNNYKKLAKPLPTNVPPYGVGFWVLVINQFNSNAYTVEVLNSKGVQISTPVTVQFTADCMKNVAIVNFNQVKQTTLP